jgi:hypothetical protein
MTIGEGIDYSSIFGLKITSASGLDKRSQEPDKCWAFIEGLGVTRAQYLASLEALRASFAAYGTMSN